jgi:hypothetical protein
LVELVELELVAVNVGVELETDAWAVLFKGSSCAVQMMNGDLYRVKMGHVKSTGLSRRS